MESAIDRIMQTYALLANHTLEVIVELFRRGEMNKIRLANKAIARFEAAELV